MCVRKVREERNVESSDMESPGRGDLRGDQEKVSSRECTESVGNSLDVQGTSGVVISILFDFQRAKYPSGVLSYVKNTFIEYLFYVFFQLIYNICLIKSLKHDIS